MTLPILYTPSEDTFESSDSDELPMSCPILVRQDAYFNREDTPREDTPREDTPSQ